MNDLFSMSNEETKIIKDTGIKIEKIEISNYRAIKHIEIPIDNFGTILKGLNKVGKTSVIEAIYFLISGKLFDGRAKLGEQGIIPVDAKKGTKTVIKLTFSNGLVFSITLWEKWNIDETMIESRETVYEVNGSVVKQVKQAYGILYTSLGLMDFMENISKKDATLSKLDVVRLFYDLKYLKEIDYKELRALVIDMVGDVDYKELINANPKKYGRLVQPLKENNLDLEMTKQRLRDEKNGNKTSQGLISKIKTLENQIEDLENKIKKGFNEEEIKNVKEKIEEIDKKINELELSKNKTNVEKIKEIEHEITLLELELGRETSKISSEYNQKLLNFQKEKNDFEIKKSELEKKYNEIKIKIDFKTKEIEKLRQTKRDLIDKEVEKLQNPKSELITAPKSKERFYLHEAVEYVEIRKKRLIELTDFYEKIKNDGIKLKEEILEHEKELENYKKEIELLNGDINNLIKNIPNLNVDNENISNIKERIETLKNKKKEALEIAFETDNDVEEQIVALKNQKTSLLDILNNEVVIKQYEKDIEEYKEKLTLTKTRLIEVEELITLIRELEKEKYIKIDANVEKIFGSNIKFKLYDYNITDESINTRLCDLLVKDGYGNFVNIKDINTGNYPIVALDFITHVKKHYNLPQTFVFIDEFGVIDDHNRKKLLEFGEQIIATEVGTTEYIEITKIKE